MQSRASIRGGWAIATAAPGRPKGSAAPFEPGAIDPARMRAAPTPVTEQLHSIALRWLATFSGPARPSALPRQYARIANRLALVWADPVLASKVLDELLTDRRGGRRGFPPQVKSELLMLRDSADRNRLRAFKQMQGSTASNRIF